MDLNLQLTTSRLVLRPLTLTDVGWCTEMLTDPEVMRFINDDGPMSATDVESEMAVSVMRARYGSVGIWAITDRVSKYCHGTVFLLPLPIEASDTQWHLVRDDDVQDCEIEIGYILRRASWGGGIATEAVAGLLRFGFEDAGFDAICAVIEPENTASRHVLEKSGFQDIGLRYAYQVKMPGFLITSDDWAVCPECG